MVVKSVTGEVEDRPGHLVDQLLNCNTYKNENGRFEKAGR